MPEYPFRAALMHYRHYHMTQTLSHKALSTSGYVTAQPAKTFSGSPQVCSISLHVPDSYWHASYHLACVLHTTRLQVCMGGPQSEKLMLRLALCCVSKLWLGQTLGKALSDLVPGSFLTQQAPCSETMLLFLLTSNHKTSSMSAC